jgi:hypothetical protein
MGFSAKMKSAVRGGLAMTVQGFRRLASDLIWKV